MAAAGCAASGLPNGPSDGFSNDGSVAADLASAQCGDVYGAVQQWLDDHRRCTSASDCTILLTPDCLPATCGDYFNRSAAGAYLDSLESFWRNHESCWADGCAPCTGMTAIGPPSCVAGACTGPLLQATGEVN